MISRHPELAMLTEYAAGILPVAQAACVSAHLNYCAGCRQTAAQLQNVGTALFETADPVVVGDAVLNRVLARLDEEAPLSYEQPANPGPGETPALLRRLMRGDFSDLGWKRITDKLRIAYLRTGDPDYEFALYHISAGGEIPEHDHRGTEMTLVLEGGFSDASGTYHAGDFLFRTAHDTHAPRALPDGDCICLAVLDAPLRFTGWKHRWMNPFLRLRAG